MRRFARTCRADFSKSLPESPAHVVLIETPVGVDANRYQRGTKMKKRISVSKVFFAYVLAQMLWLVILTQYRPG
jgi:hypothetical protein